MKHLFRFIKTTKTK